jgi:hypothetical protein
MRRFARFAVFGLCFLLVAGGCGRKDKNEPDVSPLDFMGWYFGKISGFGGTETFMDFRVGSYANFTSVYAGPKGCGRMEGRVDEHGVVTITSGLPVVTGTGLIRIYGSTATASGTMTVKATGKQLQWSVTLGTEPSDDLLGTWFGPVSGQATGAIGMDLTSGKIASGSIGSSEFAERVGGRVTPDGKVLMVRSDGDGGYFSVVCDLNSPTLMSGNWYDLVNKRSGTVVLEKVEGQLDITEETLWTGNTQEGKEMSVHLKDPSNADVLALVVDPEGGLGGTGKMTADKRFITIGAARQNALWGSITDNVASGYWYNFERGTSGTFTAVLYEGEESPWVGQWSGSSKTPEQEAGDATGTSGTVQILVNAAGYIEGQFTLTDVGVYYLTGKLEPDDTFTLIDETGRVTLPGQFRGRKGTGTYDVPDEGLNGFFELTAS